MNRLDHAKRTIEKNIIDNLSYPALEFIVLDYNSSDGFKQWICSTLSKYIKSGLLKYYRTSIPQYFHRSHARNVAFKLASGDILCNLDCDNFTGIGFAFYINEVFQPEKNCFLIADHGPSSGAAKDVFGRVCFYKKDFLKIRGFDERFSDYGWEEIDFVQRLRDTGLEEKHIQDSRFLEAISHGDDKRIKNEQLFKNIKTLYVFSPSHKITWVLALTANDKCYEFQCNEGEYTETVNIDLGTVLEGPGFHILKFPERITFARISGTRLVTIDGTFRKSNGNAFRINIARIISSSINRQIMLETPQERIINPESFGEVLLEK